MPIFSAQVLGTLEIAAGHDPLHALVDDGANHDYIGTAERQR